MVLAENLRTVQQVVDANPAFTYGGVRWLIFNASDNGLEEALVRVGRRVLIDIEQFNEWLEGQRAAPDQDLRRLARTDAVGPLGL